MSLFSIQRPKFEKKKEKKNEKKKRSHPDVHVTKERSYIERQMSKYRKVTR
jgi:hypothetical protein